MKFNDFSDVIQNEIQKKMGCEYSVEVQKITKNNSVVLTGLSIRDKECNITPIIYLEPFYEEYKAEKDINNIINALIQTYEANKVQSVSKNELKFFLKYENVKDKIVFRLVNRERNSELLESIPHVEYYDLAITFQVMVSKDATILIRNEHMKMWQVNVDMLYTQALINTPILHPYVLKNMNQVAREIIEQGSLDVDIAQEMFIGDSPMYILTNCSNVGGASCILYPHLLENFATALNDDFYILPSSIHETIFIRAKDVYRESELVDMVSVVNQTEVSEKEFLSNSVYFYSLKNGIKVIK